MPSARPVSSPPVIADINLNAQRATLGDAKQRLACSRTSCRDKIALLDISLGDYAIERRNHSFETLQLLEACNVGLIGRTTGVRRGASACAIRSNCRFDIIPLLSLACHCSTLRAPNGLSPSKVAPGAPGRSDIEAPGHYCFSHHPNSIRI